MRYLFIILTLLIPGTVYSSPAEEPEDTEISFLESARNFFGDRANYTANQIDSFFATERADDELGRSRIRIRSQFLLREGISSDLRNQYRINLKLPSLERKFKYEFGKPTKKSDKAKSTLYDQASAPQNEKSFFKGWIFNSDIGVNAAIPPQLVTRARLRKNFEAGSFIHRFSEQLTYITGENEIFEETNIDSDYIIKSDLIFRFINNKRWLVISKELRTNHGPTLLHRLTENDAFNYGATAQSIIQDGTWYLDNYRLSVNYRKNLYRQWIYLDIIPGIDFPKMNSFRRTPFITLQLEALFGGT